MLKKIVSISGKPGLYELVNQGKNMLIVENVESKKRIPAYARDKVISLGDISIYTVEEDLPLGDVLEKVKNFSEGKTIELKGRDDADIRAMFKEILPIYDEDRVYTTDIRKLLSWYNILVSAGITDFVDEPVSENSQEEVEKVDK